MRFHELSLSGAFLISQERHADERGFFARTFCQEEFAAHGLPVSVAQCNTSFSAKAGTLRGMHFQLAPHEEAKLVRVTAGAVHDVIIDLRPGSTTHGQWVAVQLTAETGDMLFVPAGFAHGFQTLRDTTEVFYQMSTPFVPGASSGLRWNDPQFGISWPLPVSSIAAKDLDWPDYREQT